MTEVTYVPRKRVLGITLAILIAAVAATTPLTVSAQCPPPSPPFITKERIYECGRPSAPLAVHNLEYMYTWWIRIRVTNPPSGDPITGVIVKDRFGAEFGVAVDFCSKGTPVLTTKGNSDKVFLEWTIGTLAPGDAATLILEVWTDINPGGHREFTSYGCYYINSGAVVKWFDIDGVKHSAETGTITVSVTPL